MSRYILECCVDSVTSAIHAAEAGPTAWSCAGIW